MLRRSPLMKERPILFSAPMVRALLDGSKTQTRRAWRVQPPPGVRVGWVPGETKQPYGWPGDRLWVREAWQVDAPHDGTWHDTQWYGCKGSPLSDIPERFQHPRFCNFRADWLHGEIRWRPGIHMPRWASRITLEVTGVRVERLQDISRGDAMDEGCPFPNMAQGPDPRQWYANLWDGINGDGAWAANPWVWVIEFRRLG